MTAIPVSDKRWIFVIWAIFQALWLYRFGIYKLEEAEVYIGVAAQLLQQDLPSVHFALYGGYIGILYLIGWLGLPWDAMYFIQLAASLAATHLFVLLLQKTSLSRNAILAGALLYVSSPIFHSWNSHLYTDALWGSLTVILMYLIFTWSNRKKILFTYLTVALILGCFFRPVGFLMVLVALVHFFCIRVGVKRMATLVIWLVVFSWFLVYALLYGENFFYARHNLDLNIICGLESTLSINEAESPETNLTILEYFASHPFISIQLFAGRLFKSLWMTRPYFSLLHNVMLGCCCLLYYIFAITGIYSIIKQRKKEWYYIISGLVIWIIPNIVFCADWHNRFMVPFIPFVLVAATFGAHRLFEQIEKRKILNKPQP